MADNPFRMLELSADATDEEIRQAYFRLAHKYHPDHTGNDPECTSRFKQVQQAYEKLTSRTHRRRHLADRQGQRCVATRSLGLGGGPLSEGWRSPRLPAGSPCIDAMRSTLRRCPRTLRSTPLQPPATTTGPASKFRPTRLWRRLQSWHRRPPNHQHSRMAPPWLLIRMAIRRRSRRLPPRATVARWLSPRSPRSTCLPLRLRHGLSQPTAMPKLDPAWGNSVPHAIAGHAAYLPEFEKLLGQVELRLAADAPAVQLALAHLTGWSIQALFHPRFRRLNYTSI